MIIERIFNLLGLNKNIILNKRYEKWRKENQGKSFKEFYAHEVLKQLKSGKSHATLGPRLKKGEEFGVSGQSFFNKILKLGLCKDHILIDYGCGTLRVGVHFIKYLDPGNYWGLDIDEALLDHGKSLLGNELYKSKLPNLYEIGPEGVKLAAASRPDFIISVAVAIHVHPDELEEYIENLAYMMTDKTRTVLTIRLSDKTTQYSGRSWAHGEIRFHKLAEINGLHISVIDSMKWNHSNPLVTGRRDTLLLTKNSNKS